MSLQRKRNKSSYLYEMISRLINYQENSSEITVKMYNFTSIKYLSFNSIKSTIDFWLIRHFE